MKKKLIFTLSLMIISTALIGSQKQKDEEEFTNLLGKYGRLDNPGRIRLLEKYVTEKKHWYFSAASFLVREYYIGKKYLKSAVLAEEILNVMYLESYGVLDIQLLMMDSNFNSMVYGILSYKEFKMDSHAKIFEQKLVNIMERGSPNTDAEKSIKKWSQMILGTYKKQPPKEDKKTRDVIELFGGESLKVPKKENKKK